MTYLHVYNGVRFKTKSYFIFSSEKETPPDVSTLRDSPYVRFACQYVTREQLQAEMPNIYKIWLDGNRDVNGVGTRVRRHYKENQKFGPEMNDVVNWAATFPSYASVSTYAFSHPSPEDYGHKDPKPNLFRIGLE